MWILKHYFIVQKLYHGKKLHLKVKIVLLLQFCNVLVILNIFYLLALYFHKLIFQLDGWIARTWKSQSSKMGSFLDPMADKVLIATLFLTLTYADLIPIALTGIIIARDVLLVVAGFVIRYRSLPPPVSY